MMKGASCVPLPVQGVAVIVALTVTLSAGMVKVLPSARGMSLSAASFTV